MTIFVFGINHSTAPVEFREKLSFSKETTKQTLQQLIGKNILQEAVLLSTCNRTEVYGVLEDIHKLNGQIPKEFSSVSDLQEDIPEKYFYQKNEKQAVSHLFQVASSLNSMVVGETQILGQVKQAYGWAAETETTGSILTRLFHAAFHAAKRVRTETQIGAGSISVGSVAVNLAQKLFRDFSEKKVVLIGAGEMAKQVVNHLKKSGCNSIYLINRTLEQAEELAKNTGGKALPFDLLDETLLFADIVITSTSSTKPILTPKTIQNAMAVRKNRPLFLIDISVPRNIDAKIKYIYNTYLFDIDDLQKIVQENLEERKQEIPKAEKITNHEVNRFFSWYESLDTVVTIQQLQKHFDILRKEEVRKNKKHFQENDWENVEKFSRSLLKKFLHSPIVRLKSCPDTGNDCHRCTILEVFGLEEECRTHI